MRLFEHDEETGATPKVADRVRIHTGGNHSNTRSRYALRPPAARAR